MQREIGLLSVAILLISHGAVWAAQPPVAVSPGRADSRAVIESRCPTFSWGSVPGAESYELVVYRVGQDDPEAEPVLRRSFPGSVGSWTPDLDEGLERGGSYAWTVRAIGRKDVSEWSPPSLFQVVDGPSQADFQEAMEVVRRYLSGAGQVPEHDEPPAPDLSIANQPSVDEVARAGQAGRVLGVTQMSIDGNIDATSFTGDGSALDNMVDVGSGTPVVYERSWGTGSGQVADFGNVRLKATATNHWIQICNLTSSTRYFVRNLSGTTSTLSISGNSCSGAAFIGSGHWFTVTGAYTHIVGVGFTSTSTTYTVVAISES